MERRKVGEFERLIDGERERLRAEEIVRCMYPMFGFVNTPSLAVLPQRNMSIDPCFSSIQIRNSYSFINCNFSFSIIDTKE